MSIEGDGCSSQPGSLLDPNFLPLFLKSSCQDMKGYCKDSKVVPLGGLKERIKSLELGGTPSPSLSIMMGLDFVIFVW